MSSEVSRSFNHFFFIRWLLIVTLVVVFVFLPRMGNFHIYLILLFVLVFKIGFSYVTEP